MTHKYDITEFKADESVYKCIGGGTLGDAFIILCKLFFLHKNFNKQVELTRYTSHPNLNPIIDLLIKEYFPFVSHKYIICNGMQDELDKTYSASFSYPVINICANKWGKSEPFFMAEPSYVEMEPFPDLAVPYYPKSKKYRIGIQVQSGKVGGNFKGFSSKWLISVINLLSKLDYVEVILLGDDFLGYRFLEKLQCYKSVNNMLGKTKFIEWLGVIKSCDLLITPEGFPAFFSMSQKIKTITFYSDYNILDRIHVEWRRENIIMPVGWNGLSYKILNKISKILFKRFIYLYPLKPEQIYALVLLYSDQYSGQPESC
jgi:hypothetical protein